MRRLISPFILQKFAEEERSGALEAATVFVDVAGFSAITGALLAHGQQGAEHGAQVMRALFSPLVEAVYVHSGFITGFAGDAFTAVFPSAGPVADTPCLLRALAAAVAMRAHLQTHPRHETPLGSFELAIKVGVAAGPLRWAILQAPSPGRAAFYFRGPSIEACAAFDRLLLPGEVVLHPSCEPLLHGTVSTVPLADGHARLTGLLTPLPRPQPQPALPPADPQVLLSFLPTEILEQTEVGEFRQAINVFINLQGDPGEPQIQAFMGLVWKLQATYGGQGNRLDFGDKGCNLLMFWGAPVSHENDVARALNFLLELRDRSPVPLRVGVTSGLSHAGFVGSDLHAEFTCYGEALNLAARLMSAAPWGGIWLDAAVQRRAASRFAMQPLGEQCFKGFAQAQAVWQLTDRLPDVLLRHKGEMVGREAELQTLNDFVRPIWQGQFAGLLVVQGEPGMGKSRLVSAFVSASVRQPTTLAGGALQVFTAQTDAISRQPFNPFRYWLRHHFARNPRATEADNKRAFDSRLDALLSRVADTRLQRKLAQLRSTLGALVDLHWEGSPYAQLDARGRYEHTLDAIMTLLQAESLQQPVVLVIEDMHWLDAGSADVLRRVLGGLRPGPGDGGHSAALAIVATSRPATEALCGGDVEHRQLLLTPLLRAQLAALAARQLGGPPAPELLELVASRSAGNPFFAERVLSYLHDDGKLRFVDGQWAVDPAALALAPLPADVRLIFVAQLDRLGQAAREVVQAAAVLGREFDQDVLADMLQPVGLGTALQVAQAAGILGPLSGSRHAFRHILLRDAAYDMQIQARRANLHQGAAASLERLWARDLAPHLGDIGHHYEAAFHLGIAALREPARVYLGKAGAQAFASFANAAAADLFSRALALTEDTKTAERWALLEQREAVHDFQGDRDAQANDVAALEALALQSGQLPLQAEAAMRRVYLAGGMGNYSASLAASLRALDLAQQAALPALEAASSRTAGAALRVLGRFDEALSHFEQAISAAKSAQQPYQEAAAWTAWSSLQVRRGHWPSAIAALEPVVTGFEQTGPVFRLAMALNDLGLAFAAGGQLGRAQSCFERTLALTREIDERPGQVPPLFNLALVLVALGDWRRAETLADEAIALAIEMQDGYLQTRGWLARARAALLSGDLTTAQRAGAAADEAASTRYPDLRAGALAHRSALALHRAHADEAAALAVQAVAGARATGDRCDLGLALFYQGLAWEAQGKLDAAEAGYQECTRLDGATGERWDARAGLARVCLARGRPREALAEAEPILAQLWAAQEAGEPGHGLAPSEEPLRVYLTCYQVLAAAEDVRGTRVLERAAALLAASAEPFDDPIRRRQCLEANPVHRAIYTGWQMLGQGLGQGRAQMPE